jgi:hypothetical protein
MAAAVGTHLFWITSRAAAQAAVLSGPEEALRWLPHGGAIVFDDGSHEVVELRLTRAISSRALQRLAAPALRT